MTQNMQKLLQIREMAKDWLEDGGTGYEIDSVARAFLHDHPATESRPITIRWLKSAGWQRCECRRPRYGKRVEELGGYNSDEWERADAYVTKSLSGRTELYCWADRVEFWMVFPQDDPRADPVEVALENQPTTRGELWRLCDTLGIQPKRSL